MTIYKKTGKELISEIWKLAKSQPDCPGCENNFRDPNIFCSCEFLNCLTISREKHKKFDEEIILCGHFIPRKKRTKK